jgi:hypothetical protein
MWRVYGDRASGAPTSSVRWFKHSTVMGYRRLGTTTRCGGQCDTVLERIRTIVRCEALTERIIGGDRADGVGAFE